MMKTIQVDNINITITQPEKKHYNLNQLKTLYGFLATTEPVKNKIWFVEPLTIELTQKKRFLFFPKKSNISIKSKKTINITKVQLDLHKRPIPAENITESENNLLYFINDIINNDNTLITTNKNELIIYQNSLTHIFKQIDDKNIVFQITTLYDIYNQLKLA